MDLTNPFKDMPNKMLRSVNRHEILIRLRWMAVAGVAVALGVAWLLKIGMPYHAHLIALGVLAALNAAYSVWFKRSSKAASSSHEEDPSATASFRLLLFAQITTDWVLLTVFLHFAGGIMNPFVFVYVLHIIIGVTMADQNLTVPLTALGMTLITVVTLGEYFKVIDCHPLLGEPSVCSMDPLMIFGRLFALGMVLMICGFVTHYLVSGIREREEKLYAMSKDLVALSHVKEEFFRRVTHDLKSPVAAMMSAIDTILLISKDTLADKPADMLKRIRNRGEGLLTLIKDLLEIARRSTPNYAKSFKPVDAAPLLKEVVGTEEFKAGEKKITMKVDISASPVVIAEDSSLREVFSNLVSNAVRYTPEGGSVSVSLAVQNGSMRLDVADSGIGISEEDQKKLFTEFFRASNARKFTAAGTGLGLSITKAHVEAFGGKISVRSTLGEGTTFTVEIPTAPAQGQGKTE